MRVVALALLAAGCQAPTDEEPPRDVITAGADVDEEVAHTIEADWALPGAFDAALDRFGLAPEDLSYPDAGATFTRIPSRLKWTDTIRKEGPQAAIFAHMVGETAEAAVAGAGERRVADVLVAAHVFNQRSDLIERRLDRAFRVEPTEDAPLAAALRRFYEHAPVEGAPDDLPPWSEVEADVTADAARFPWATQAHLALAIDGLLWAADLRDDALHGKDGLAMSRWAELFDTFASGDSAYSSATAEFGEEAHDAFDFDEMALAGAVAARAVESLRIGLADAPLGDGQTLRLVGPLGRIAITMADTADTHDEDDGFLVVDGGGDDTWSGRIATNTTFWQPVSVTLDLRGDDAYVPTNDWAITDRDLDMDAGLAQGFGLFGVAIVDDAAGDDAYFASAFAQGAATFGVGALVDHEGADTYAGYDHSQGSADYGEAVLLDLGDGVDRYTTLQRSQGYGGVRGVGWLVDEAGDDVYEAITDPIVYDWAGEGANWSGSQGFGYGVRDGFFTAGAPILGGGLGALFDLAGDDDFTCSVMCQGFGYAWGTGLLWDPEGDDDHLVTHKYAMGSATHWAVGLLVDGGGDDTYRNNDDDECIAEGYDGSVAFHLDLGDGNDTYTLDHTSDSTLGLARHPAMGIFVNEGGDDTYELPGSGAVALGRAIIDEGDRAGYMATTPSLGMFLDLGGTDTYNTDRTDVGDGREWVQTEPLGGDWDPAYDFGYGLDAP